MSIQPSMPAWAPRIRDGRVARAGIRRGHACRECCRDRKIPRRQAGAAGCDRHPVATWSHTAVYLGNTAGTIGCRHPCRRRRHGRIARSGLSSRADRCARCFRRPAGRHSAGPQLFLPGRDPDSRVLDRSHRHLAHLPRAGRRLRGVLGRPVHAGPAGARAGRGMHRLFPDQRHRLHGSHAACRGQHAARGQRRDPHRIRSCRQTLLELPPGPGRRSGHRSGGATHVGADRIQRRRPYRGPA